MVATVDRRMQRAPCRPRASGVLWKLLSASATWYVLLGLPAFVAPLGRERNTGGHRPEYAADCRS